MKTLGLLIAVLLLLASTASGQAPQFVISTCDAECVTVDLEWGGTEEYADALFTLSKPAGVASVTLSLDLDRQRLQWVQTDDYVRVLVTPKIQFPIPTFSQGELVEICFDVAELAAGCHVIERFDYSPGSVSAESVGDANGQSVQLASPPVLSGAVSRVRQSCGLVGLEILLVPFLLWKRGARS